MVGENDGDVKREAGLRSAEMGSWRPSGYL